MLAPYKGCFNWNLLNIKGRRGKLTSHLLLPAEPRPLQWKEPRKTNPSCRIPFHWLWKAVIKCQDLSTTSCFVPGRTGRYTLIEKWRETERHLAPNENPVVSLNKWGQYASDVQLILQRTGPSVSERPTSEGLARVPERGLYRQSLPPLAKLRPSGTDRSLKRKEPKRKSLTFTGSTKGLREIFGKSRDTDGVYSWNISHDLTSHFFASFNGSVSFF